jgi:hypothetical protein
MTNARKTGGQKTTSGFAASAFAQTVADPNAYPSQVYSGMVAAGGEAISAYPGMASASSYFRVAADL